MYGSTAPQPHRLHLPSVEHLRSSLQGLDDQEEARDDNAGRLDLPSTTRCCSTSLPLSLSSFTEYALGAYEAFLIRSTYVLSSRSAAAISFEILYRYSVCLRQLLAVHWKQA